MIIVRLPDIPGLSSPLLSLQTKSTFKGTVQENKLFDNISIQVLFLGFVHLFENINIFTKIFLELKNKYK